MNIQNIPAELILKYDSQTMLAKSIYDEIIKNGDLVLLEPMNDKKIALIHNIIRNYDNLTSFTINNNGKKQIVIRPFLIEEIDEEKTRISAKHNFYYEYYALALMDNKKLLQLQTVKNSTYSKIGMIYYRMSKYKTGLEEENLKKKAITYFTVANALAKEIDEKFVKFDLEDFIDKIKNSIDMGELEDLPYNYDIENMDEIIVCINKGMNLDEICSYFNFDETKRNELALISAKNAYLSGFSSLGDKYIKLVESSKNKSNLVKKELMRIRNNKKLYLKKIVRDKGKLSFVKLK